MSTLIMLLNSEQFAHHCSLLWQFREVRDSFQDFQMLTLASGR